MAAVIAGGLGNIIEVQLYIVLVAVGIARDGHRRRPAEVGSDTVHARSGVGDGT